MDELSELLIGKVHKHPYLYDDQHTEYKNLNSKEQAWKEIGDELKMSPLKAKARWKNLRDSYVKYKNQLNKVTDAAGQEAVNNRFLKWTGRTNLSFLDETLARRSQSSSIAHVPTKSVERKAITPTTLKRAKTLPYDKIAREAAKKLKLNTSSNRSKRKSQSKQRRSLQSNKASSPKKQHTERTFKNEIQQTVNVAPYSDVLSNDVATSEASHFEVSTTNGIAASTAARDHNAPRIQTNLNKSNDGDFIINYLEDKKKFQSVLAGGGGGGGGTGGGSSGGSGVVAAVDAIDHLFSSYAQTFRTLPLRQQVNIKVEMAKLFAIAEIESQQ